MDHSKRFDELHWLRFIPLSVVTWYKGPSHIKRDLQKAFMSSVCPEAVKVSPWCDHFLIQNTRASTVLPYTDIQFLVVMWWCPWDNSRYIMMCKMAIRYTVCKIINADIPNRFRWQFDHEKKPVCSLWASTPTENWGNLIIENNSNLYYMLQSTLKHQLNFANIEDNDNEPYLSNYPISIASTMGQV